MKNSSVLLSIIGVLLGFAGGFLVANALNRSQINQLLSENGQLKNQQSEPKGNQQSIELSENEIRSKIDEAEKNPENFTFQKKLGLAFYRYAASKQDAALLAEVATLLDRAHKLNPDDYQVIVSLGNVNFDLGQLKKDSGRNLQAREVYQKALKKNPKDIDVITDFGLTYLLSGNPDVERATVELKKALEQDAKHERALLYMAQAQIELKNSDEGANYLEKLKRVNPKYPGLSEMEKKLSFIK